MIVARVRKHRDLGPRVRVPYTESDIANANSDAVLQAQEIVTDPKVNGGVDLDPKTDIVSMIAFLQRMGRDPPQTIAPPPTRVSAMTH